MVGTAWREAVASPVTAAHLPSLEPSVKEVRAIFLHLTLTLAETKTQRLHNPMLNMLKVVYGLKFYVSDKQ